MTADILSLLDTMPSLRDFAKRCRELALIARHPATRLGLLKLANDLEWQAAANDDRRAVEPCRETG